MKSNKWLSAAILACTLPAVLVAAPKQLQVSGIYIKTMDGCNYRLTGVNTSGMEYSACGFGPPKAFGGNITENVTGAIKVWKANLIRLPLNQDFWFGYSDGIHSSANVRNIKNMEKYRGYVDAAVETVSKLNCHIELDLHWSGNGNWGSSIPVKQQNMPDDHSIDFWKDVAKRYANNPAVIFNLYNEPHDDLWEVWRNGGMSNSGFHTPGHQALVDAVRSTGANNIIIAGGLGWAWDLTGVPSYALKDTASGYGIAYDAHIYDNKGGNSEEDKVNLWNQNVASAVSAGYCVIIGEFGGWSDSGCNPFESNLISWINGNNPQKHLFNATAWNFSTEASPYLLSGWSGFTPTSCHGILVQDWLAELEPVNCSGTGKH